MLFAVLYWNDEHSYDSFHANNPDLYRITTTLVENKGEHLQTIGGTGQVQGPAFKEAVPEIRSYVRVLGGDIYSDVIANEKVLHLRPLFVDANFFDVFSFPLVLGNAQKVLSDINAVVVTESTARKFFNTVDVFGQNLTTGCRPVI
jgi:putative ABC transport system permease protein